VGLGDLALLEISQLPHEAWCGLHRPMAGTVESGIEKTKKKKSQKEGRGGSYWVSRTYLPHLASRSELAGAAVNVGVDPGESLDSTTPHHTASTRRLSMGRNPLSGALDITPTNVISISCTLRTTAMRTLVCWVIRWPGSLIARQ
jgi:hypothetical protein